MCGPPDPEMRNRPAANGTANRRAEWKKPEEFSLTASDFQAEKLRRLCSFCQATACTISELAFAVSR
jgi:hypothetical protein